MPKALVGLTALVLALGVVSGCDSPRSAPKGSFFFPPGQPTTQTSAPPTASPSAAPATGYKGLGVESIPPEVLKKYAAPALPTDKSRLIQAMLDVRAPSGGLVSVDGKRMFFTWSVTGTVQVWRLDGAMSFPVQLTGGEDTTSVSGLTPDGKTLLVSRDRGGEENPGLYMMSPDGGALTAIQHTPKVQTFLQWIADDNKTIYFRANDQSPDSYAIYRYDLSTKKKETAFAEPGIWSLADVRKGKDGADRLLLFKSVGSNMEEFFEYDTAKKQLTPLFGQNEREEHEASYGPEEGEVIVLSPKLGEHRRLYSFKAGKLTPISAEIKFDVSGFALDRTKKRILYTVNEGGYTKLLAMDARSKKPLQLPKLPAADHVFFGATSLNGKYTSLQIDPGTSPAQAFVYDWDAATLKQWHKPATPELDTAKFARVTLESYPARDGTAIPMFVRKPSGCDQRSAQQGPCPVIVSFHGGPESQTVAGFSTRAQLFVDAGFIFAEPNVRGSDGYGKSWIHADDGPKRAAILTDIEDASKYARTKWAVGGKAPKVGIYGGSYGGYSTLVGMTIFAGAYDAGASVVGISSLLTFLENTAPYRRILRISEYGDPQKDRQALEQLSPITHIDKLQAPMLLIQGATDPRVPVGESLQFHEALQKKGVPSELIIFPDEGHGMKKRSNQVLALGHTIRFFEKHLR